MRFPGTSCLFYYTAAQIHAIPQLLAAPRICASPVHITSRQGSSVSWLFGPTPFLHSASLPFSHAQPLLGSSNLFLYKANRIYTIPLQCLSSQLHCNAYRRFAFAGHVGAIPFADVTVPCSANPLPRATVHIYAKTRHFRAFPMLLISKPRNTFASLTDADPSRCHAVRCVSVASPWSASLFPSTAMRCLSRRFCSALFRC